MENVHLTPETETKLSLITPDGLKGGALSSLISFVAETLRGYYKPTEYGRVILPFMILRRLDCVLKETKATDLCEPSLSFYNESALDMVTLLGDPENVADNLNKYVQGFSPAVRDIFERFRFSEQIERLRKGKLLYQVTERFASINLGPDVVTNHEMGLAFEKLIRRFAEVANETSGEHFTPQDAVNLIVSLVFCDDSDVLRPGNVTTRTIYDPTAGTGGMLSVAGELLLERNPQAVLTMYGQEINDESYAVCKADMLIKGQNINNLASGNTLSDDGHPDSQFDYMLSNPPYGTSWKSVEPEISREHQRGYDGRFGPGLPKVSDGQMLFLMHLVSKMKPVADGGSRIGILMSSSPMYSGAAGSGESEIRRYLFENDLVEAIVGLPNGLFYNTGIFTYIWVLTNNKPLHRQGLVQIINAAALSEKIRKPLGAKRKVISSQNVESITTLFSRCVNAQLSTVTDAAGKVVQHVVWDGDTEPVKPTGGKTHLAPLSRIFRNEEFGYRTITVERPLLDKDGSPVIAHKGKGKGKPLADSSLRDTENVPLIESVDEYFERTVLPHVPDAWIDHDKTRIGYEIQFNRIFHVFEPLRPLSEIDADLQESANRIRVMLDGLS